MDGKGPSLLRIERVTDDKGGVTYTVRPVGVGAFVAGVIPVLLLMLCFLLGVLTNALT